MPGPRHARRSLRRSADISSSRAGLWLFAGAREASPARRTAQVFLMNDQLQMVVRYFLTVIGSLAAAKGLISPGDWSTLTTDILATIGPVTMLVTFLWGLYVHSHNAKIASVNAISGVKVVRDTTPAAMVTAAPKM